jgi:hypothetical protein
MRNALARVGRNAARGAAGGNRALGRVARSTSGSRGG